MGVEPTGDAVRRHPTILKTAPATGRDVLPLQCGQLPPSTRLGRLTLERRHRGETREECYALLLQCTEPLNSGSPSDHPPF